MKDQDQKLTDEDARIVLEEQKRKLTTTIQTVQERQADRTRKPAWARALDDRQWQLVRHCRNYVAEGAYGLPAHQLMIIVDHLAFQLETAGITIKQQEAIEFEKWLRETFGELVQGDTLKDRVMSVIQHYATQMGRWLRK